MDLLELKSRDGIEVWHRLASAVKSSTPYLSQLAHGHRKPSPKFARALVQAEPRLTLAALRPDIYGAGTESAA